MKRTEKILAPLASLVAQEKYLVGADKDEYYLPEELLDNALSALELEKNSAQVHELIEKIRQFRFPTPYVPSELVHNCVAWKNIRELCITYLNEKGFDLAMWEENEL